jgi:hypothetical protein
MLGGLLSNHLGGRTLSRPHCRYRAMTPVRQSLALLHTHVLHRPVAKLIYPIRQHVQHLRHLGPGVSRQRCIQGRGGFRR